MLAAMDIQAWRRTCRLNPLPHDVAGQRVEVFHGMTYAPGLMLPALLATARFGVGAPPFAPKEVPHGALS